MLEDSIDLRCPCGAVATHPRSGLCTRCYKREWRLAHPEANRRVGKRAAQKRLADEKLKHPCALCGRLVVRQAVMCLSCAHSQRRQDRDLRRALIAKRWSEGRTLREIADELGSTEASVGVEMARMRRSGVELPYRYNWKAAA